MDEDFVQGFLGGFDDSRFPDGFHADFDVLECLAHNDTGETLLVRARQTGTFAVAKCYRDKTLLSLTTESDLLRKLNHDGLPCFVAEYESENMLCVVREYIDGTPLDQYVTKHKVTPQQTVSFGVQLCDILTFLHGLTPPVIHRDIKPQNIIVNAEGRVTLIDLGISRVYSKDAKEDTVCFGTKHFAPPEQYGYAQTDCRADIFSLGVLLGWLLTGEVDTKTAVSRIENARLRRVIQRCTAFAPERRFASVARVKAALLNADGHKQRSALRMACGILAGIACLCVGFAVGRYTEVTPAFLSAPSIVFEEQLIEQAVRLTLGKQAGDPITHKELLSVTELYIYGHKAVSSSDEYLQLGMLMAQNDGSVRNGGIRMLDDLLMLKNLNTLNMALEDISDLSSLGQLLKLEQLDLRHNPIEDISALASLPALRDLCLYGSRVSDLSPLARCALLENLNIGKTFVTDVQALAGTKSLKYLHAQQTPLETLSGIDQFAQLEQIGLSHVRDGDLTPLLAVPHLREAHLDESLRTLAEQDLRHAQFTIIYP